MNRLHPTGPSTPRRFVIGDVKKALMIIGAVALALLLPTAAFAQFPEPDPDPDPDPGPFCAARTFTDLAFQQIIALQGPALDCVNWARSGGTFFVDVKLRQTHRYASTAEECLYEDGLWTSYGRSINVSSATPQMFLRASPTTTQAQVSVVDPSFPVRYSFNVRYQEDVGGGSSTAFNPKRKKKLCINLPVPNTAPGLGCAQVYTCP